MVSSDSNNMAPDFLVHDNVDSVGVVVVEDAASGKTLTGWIMDVDKTVQVEATQDIPLGHKIALTDMSAGDKVIKYGFPIGQVTAPIGKGGHLHVHNTKTEKW